MLVFIDESGDPGLKLGQGSSDYFIVALVSFEDDDEANLVDQRINLLRHELGFRPDFEFHFNKLKAQFRQAFLSAVANFEFFYHGVVVNKRKLMGPGFQFKESFYKYTCNLVFQNAKPYLENATVVIDGSGSREFRLQLGSYLRKRINDTKGKSRFIGKVKVQDSHRNNLLQLADMIVGAIARSYTTKPESKTFRQLVQHREINVQFWPK